ncbi:MAG TPA: hypothetical protein VFB00_07835, partial [Terriglobales bacterium]|nr:hypothetical protein [Terriglobales bacterium]
MAEPRTLTTAKTRLTTAGGATYIYDGDGNRVEKCTAGTTAGTCAASPTGTLYWMDVTGGIIAESDLSGNLQEEYIFFGRRIARREVSNGAVHYYFADFLGSTSLVTDANGAMSTCPSSPTGYTSILTGEEESDFYPYGGEIKLCDNSPQHFKFTGKERDQESGLDEMVARYYSSST